MFTYVVIACILVWIVLYIIHLKLQLKKSRAETALAAVKLLDSNTNLTEARDTILSWTKIHTAEPK